MSLHEISTIAIIRQQIVYKFRAHVGFISILIGLQALAVLAFSGTSSMGTGSDGVNINVTGYSSDGVFFFTMLWVFCITILLTTREYRDYDFIFAGNRFTSGISTIGLLLAGCCIGGLGASLSGVFLRVLHYCLDGPAYIAREGFFLSPTEILVGMIATILYFLLISAIGYLCGALVQVSKLFVIVPLLLIGMALRLNLFCPWVSKEHILGLFILKVLGLALLLFSAGLLCLNRLEVRR